MQMMDSTSSDFQGLIPLLVAGYGRSGTTALMALLGTDSRVVMGRAYPFEARPLSYAAKMALLLARNAAESQVPGERFFAFEDCGLSPPPWLPPGTNQAAPGDIESPPALEWFQHLWALFEARCRKRSGGHLSRESQQITPHSSPLTTHHSPTWHAEKVAAWVPAFVRHALPARTLYLARDPRDMYLSSNALMRQRNYFSFGRGPGDSDLDHARNLAYEILLYFENYRADMDRADCLLVPYSDLVRDLDRVAYRLGGFAGLRCLAKDMPTDLGFHRTANSPEKSIDRWRQEPLPKGVSRFLETYLQDCFATFRYEFSNNPRICPGVEYAPPRVNREPSQASSYQSPLFTPHSPTADDNGLRVFLNEGKSEIDLPIDPFEARIFCEIWVSLNGPGIGQVSLSWRPANRENSSPCKLSLPWFAARHGRVLRFPVGRLESWQGRVAGLRLELTKDQSYLADDVAYVRWLRLVE